MKRRRRIAHSSIDAVIAESAIDTVFNTDVIAQLAQLAKLPLGADVGRFG